MRVSVGVAGFNRLYRGSYPRVGTTAHETESFYSTHVGWRAPHAIRLRTANTARPRRVYLRVVNVSCFDCASVVIYDQRVRPMRPGSEGCSTLPPRECSECGSDATEMRMSVVWVTRGKIWVNGSADAW